MRLVIILALLVAVSAHAQTVYKCVNTSGTTVFSQRPCDADPSKVETVDTSRSMKAGSGGSVQEQSEFAAMNEVRRQCNVRRSNIASRYTSRRRAIDAEIAALERRITTANNNLAGATLESGLRQQIAGLSAERGQIAAAEAQEAQAEHERCQAAIEAEEKRIAKAQRARAEGAEAEAQDAKTAADEKEKHGPAQ